MAVVTANASEYTETTTVSAGSATRSAPTLDTEGLPLGSVDAAALVLEAASGQTLSGGGTMKCYYYDPSVAAWVRAPDADLTMPSGTSGQRRITFQGLAVVGKRGRILYAPSSVTVSGGATVKVYLLGSFVGGV